MIPRDAQRFAAGAAALLFLAACLGGNSQVTQPPSSGPRDCAELSDSVFGKVDSLDAPRYRVIAPNGGESFKVGDSLHVTVTGAGAASAVVELWRISRAGSVKARLPGSPSFSFNPRKTCEFAFVVPESLSTGTSGSFSLVADSLEVRVSDYSDPTDFDASDSLFKIVK